MSIGGAAWHRWHQRPAPGHYATMLLVTISAATKQQHSYLRSPGGRMSQPDNSRPAQAGEVLGRAVLLWCCCDVVAALLLWPPCCCAVVALLLSAVLLGTETLCAPAGGRGLRPSTAQTGVTLLQPPPTSTQLHPASRQARAGSYCFEQDHYLCCKT